MVDNCGTDNQDCGASLAQINYETQRYYYENCSSGYGGGCPDYAGATVFTVLGLVTAGAARPVADAAGGAIAETVTTATTAACADGDCTNETQGISTGVYSVYQYIENGVTKYIGQTIDFARRESEWAKAGWKIEPIPGLKELSKFDARAVEQILIENYGLDNLYNKISSIAATNPIYQSAIQRGTELLKLIGFGK